MITGYNGSVTIALANNPGGSTLGGTLTVPAVNGVATFSGLTLNKAGTGYTLKAHQRQPDSPPPAVSTSRRPRPRP